MKNSLEQAGLTSNEAEVYLALLREGKSSATEIVNTVGMHRTSVYSTLARLESKGLVNAVTLDGSRRFAPVHPRKLKEGAAEQLHLMEQVLPALERMHDDSQKGEQVQHYSGIGGLQSIYEMMLKEKHDYLGYGPALRAEKLLRHYLQRFTKQTMKHGIQSRMIYDQRFEELVPNKLQKRRYLTSEELSPESVRIFGNKVAIMLLSTSNPLGIVIHNETLADGFRKRFERLWKIANK